MWETIYVLFCIATNKECTLTILGSCVSVVQQKQHITNNLNFIFLYIVIHSQRSLGSSRYIIVNLIKAVNLMNCLKIILLHIRKHLRT